MAARRTAMAALSAVRSSPAIAASSAATASASLVGAAAADGGAAAATAACLRACLASAVSSLTIAVARHSASVPSPPALCCWMAAVTTARSAGAEAAASRSVAPYMPWRRRVRLLEASVRVWQAGFGWRWRTPRLHRMLQRLLGDGAHRRVL